MTTNTATDLRQRTVDALYLHAALETDPGAAGYAEGMAQRIAGERGPLTENYLAKLQAWTEAHHDVATVECDGTRVRVTGSNRIRNSWITLPTAEQAQDLAATLAGCKTS